MTHQPEPTIIDKVIETIIANGIDGLGEAFTLLFNEAMKIERSKVLRAAPWERNEERLGHANGYKPKSINSRLGKLHLQIPQVRGDIEFYPSSLEKGLRSERALKKVAMAEMYIQGGSTDKAPSECYSCLSYIAQGQHHRRLVIDGRSRTKLLRMCQ